MSESWLQRRFSPEGRAERIERFSATLAELRASVEALQANQDRIERRIAELRARHEAERGARD